MTCAWAGNCRCRMAVKRTHIPIGGRSGGQAAGKVPRRVDIRPAVLTHVNRNACRVSPRPTPRRSAPGPAESATRRHRPRSKPALGRGWLDLRSKIAPDPASHPLPSRATGREQLEEPGVAAIDDQNMAITAGVRASLDRSVRWNRVGPGVALIGILKRDGHFRLACRHHRVGDSTRVPLIDGAKIRMKRFVQADSMEDLPRPGIDRQAGHILVPGVIVRENA